MNPVATKIKKDQITEEQAHQFHADASDLGWKPYQWPVELEVVPAIGNGLNFTYHHRTPERVEYRQIAGCVSIIINND